MKVLVISQDFPPNPGGVAVFVHNLCIQLCRCGHQVHVLTRHRYDGNAFDQTQPYLVYRYSPSHRLSSLAPVTRTLLLHKENMYDVLFLGHFTTTHALGALAVSRLWNVPYVILSHGNDILRYSIHTKADEIVARLLTSNVSLMLANSRFTAERICEMGYRREIEVLNPGVDKERFNPGVEPVQIRRKYGLDGHGVLLTTARLTAKKNVGGVLRALPKVIEQLPDVLYLIAGDGVERKQLEALCDTRGLRPYVRFLGHIENDQLPSLYCASDVFVMPSYEVKESGDVETFGISFVEANACGLPVIGGRSGGTTDAVVDGETGLLVDPHDTDAISSAIIRLLTDPELARQLGENGRKRVEKELNWEIIGEKLENYLKQVIRKQ